MPQQCQCLARQRSPAHPRAHPWLCNPQGRLQHRHIPGAPRSSSPPSPSSPSCRVYPSARGDWLAASTRNPGRGKQTKHRLSPGGCRASARLPSSFPSWKALPRREEPLQLGIESFPPCLPPQQTWRDLGCTPGHCCFHKEQQDNVSIASCAQL